MRNKILITGASGFIGYHLILECLVRGFEVYAAVRDSSDIEHLQELPVYLTSLRYEEAFHLTTEIQEKQYDYIIHAAAITRAGSAKIYSKVNAEYTRNLAIAASGAGSPVKKFAFISSLAASGPGLNGHPISEVDFARPLTNYGKSKLMAENFLNEVEDLPFITFRPTVVYGPREREVFKMIKAIAKGVEPYIGRASQQTSFVYVKDLARVIVDALLSSSSRKCYNVSDGFNYDRYAFASTVKKILKKSTVKFHLPKLLVKATALFTEGSSTILNQERLRQITAGNWSCTIEQARIDLNYQPRYSLQDGLEDTIDWYRKNKWMKYDF